MRMGIQPAGLRLCRRPDAPGTPGLNKGSTPPPGSPQIFLTIRYSRERQPARLGRNTRLNQPFLAGIPVLNRPLLAGIAGIPAKNGRNTGPKPASLRFKQEVIHNAGSARRPAEQGA